jgi:cellulose synthase/poly-beta-1,6-N-acetylglucosamine synthase-like glycosyltransferase
MGVWLLWIYVLVSLLAVAQAVLVIVQTWEHHRFARSRLAMMRKYPRKGRALVVIPCRGVDVGLARNLRTLFHQDYKNYQVRFVVESAADPACSIVRRLMAAHPETDAELLVAGSAEGEGQKVHNLRFATSRLPMGVEYLAFVDSDARLRRQWLRCLLARLDRPGIGAVTGYRWFVPSRPSFANYLLHSVNSHIAVLFGSRCPTIVWGGSWAIRRDRFEALEVRSAWAGTLSDDLVASRLLHGAGLRVRFEPACLVASPADVTLSGLLEFARRQYLMGRWYVPGGWVFALSMTTFVNAVSAANVGVLIAALATGLIRAWIPAAFCAVLYTLSLFSGLLRQDVALSYFPDLHAKLRKARRFEVWTGPLVALVNWISVLGSVAGRRVRWRGIEYVVHPNGKVAAAYHPSAGGRTHRPMDGPSSDDLGEPVVLPMPSIRVRTAGESPPETSQRRCA